MSLEFFLVNQNSSYPCDLVLICGELIVIYEQETSMIYFRMTDK